MNQELLTVADSITETSPPDTSGELVWHIDWTVGFTPAETVRYGWAGAFAKATGEDGVPARYETGWLPASDGDGDYQQGVGVWQLRFKLGDADWEHNRRGANSA